MSSPKGYVDSEYLQLLEAQLMDYKRKSYVRMNIQPGNSVLDVGCGPGTDTLHLAESVGASGEVVGIDYDIEMITAAKQRAHEAGFGDFIRHEQGNATSLAFASEQFDASRSERLFQHLIYPERALSEMARVTKRGGFVVVLDTDWGTLSINSSLPDVERRLVQFSNDYCMHNAYSGRHLVQLFHSQGLEDVSVEVLPYQITSYTLCREVIVLGRRENEALAAGVLTQDEIYSWQDDLEQLNRGAGFFASFNLVLASGRKV